MNKLLQAFTLLFVCTSMAFAGHDHPTGTRHKHGTNCHASCKAQHPNVNSPAHKECMDKCAKGDHK